VEPPFQTKLPNLGTSIFTEMSMMASQYDAINLSQGFPEFDTPDFLKSAINQAINEGKNQYCLSTGLPELLNQISQMVQRRYQAKVPDEQKAYGMNNITVTSAPILFNGIKCSDRID